MKARFVTIGVGCCHTIDEPLRKFHNNRHWGIVGIRDPRKGPLDRPATDWFGDYLGDLAGLGTSAHYSHEVRSRC